MKRRRDTVFSRIFRTNINKVAKRHFYSIAPEFGIHDFQLDRTYHYTNYQFCLQSAAETLDHKFTIVAPTTCSIESETVIPLLSAPESSKLLSEVTRLIEKLVQEQSNERIVILFYEGSLALANEFSILARQFPSVLFIVNLFLSEPFYNLDTAFRSCSDSNIKGILGELQSPEPALCEEGGKLSQAANLIVFTETETKSFTARLLGFTAIKRWRTFSAIHDMRRATQNQNHSNKNYRVLVPLSSWQLSEGLVRDMISVKKETDTHIGQRKGIEFHITGYLPDHDVQHMLVSLSDAGFEVSSTSRTTQDYVEMYACHDVVWLPNRYYILQSSGKALDALVQGTPIIAPVGTYGWREQNRWVGGAPGYSTTGEARDLFLNLQFILPAVASELKMQNEVVRDYYSPVETIRALVT